MTIDRLREYTQTHCMDCGATISVPSTYTGRYPLCYTCRQKHTPALPVLIGNAIRYSHLTYIAKDKAFSLPMGVLLKK
jgi:hypothetical protein